MGDDRVQNPLGTLKNILDQLLDDVGNTLEKISVSVDAGDLQSAEMQLGLLLISAHGAQRMMREHLPSAERSDRGDRGDRGPK